VIFSNYKIRKIPATLHPAAYPRDEGEAYTQPQPVRETTTVCLKFRLTSNNN